MKKIKIIFFLICLSFTHSLKALDNQLLSYQSIYEINLDTEREIKKRLANHLSQKLMEN